MNTQERQLAEMLHRVTPEPPRRVSVEDVARRVASQAGRRAGGGYRERRWPGWNRRWAPVLAAVSVFAVAGASAAIATMATSHPSRTPASGGSTPARPASFSPSSTVPSPPSTPAGPSSAPLRVAGGIWGAELINRQSFAQDSLVSGGNSLYAAGGGYLDRIDPATGRVLRSAPYSPPVPGLPVVLGNTVWVVWSYGGGLAELRGYDTRTLAQVASVQVPAIGGVAGSAQGVLAAGPGGRLYLAAGDIVAVVDPASRRLARRIYLLAGQQASSVAVSPDGSTLYIGISSAGSFRLLTYDLGSGIISGSATLQAGGAGNLVATDGGVWGTAGVGMSEWVWFAPAGDLSRVTRVGQGAGAGLMSLPAVSGAAVWIGGTHELVCADPGTGRVRASVTIPANHGVVEYVGSPAVLSDGRAYALYQDQAAHLAGVVALTPPAACGVLAPGGRYSPRGATPR